MTFRLLTTMALLLATATTWAQGDDSKYGATEEQQFECKEAIQLYRVYRDQKAWDDAYKFWQNVLVKCPGDVTQNVYIDGAKFIKKQLKAAKGTDRVEPLIDSLWMVYDMRMEYFPSTKKNPNNRCSVLGYKAMDYVKLYKSKELDAFPWLEESVMCLKEKSRAAFVSKYYELLGKKWQEEEEGEAKEAYYDRLLNEYLMLSEWCDTNVSKAKAAIDGGAEGKKLKKATRNLEAYETAKKNLDEIFVAVATCDKMLPVMQAKLEAAPEDMELKKRALRLFNKKDCTDSDLYLQLAEEVCAAEPACDCKYSLSLGFAKKGEKAKALQYVEEAIEMCQDSPDAQDIYIKAAQIASANNKHSKAREYARQVLKMNPNNGEAYIVLGDAYAASSKACDDGGLGSKAVFWLAVDYYQRAKSKDASVADKANSRIARNKKYFPTRTELFNVGLKAGDSFTVKCFGETTTIREAS